MNEMPDILRRILDAKRAEVERLRQLGNSALREAAAAGPPVRGFRASILAARGVALIAEIKKASPSAGIIRPSFRPADIARAYEGAGAACISVLTEEQFFQGTLAHLAEARKAVGLPVLRKDFIVDELQVLQSRACGADACLLIARALEPGRLRDLFSAVKQMGMDALVEVHDEAELELALSTGADLIGVNNRDLRSFRVSLSVTERLARLVPPGVTIVSESGINSRADVERLRDCGVRAILVGEALMRAADVEAAARALVGV